MRIILELIGAGAFAYLVALGVTSWLSYRARADKALKEQEEARKPVRRKKNV